MPEQGPYLTNPPRSFVVDANGYAWVLWDDGTMSMVVSTPANDSPLPWTYYEPRTPAPKRGSST